MIPVYLLTGFLGSGKTTFLNQLLKSKELGKVVIIVNEFGEIGLDHLLVVKPTENILLLEGGCLCCEVRGDLVQTLSDLRTRRDAGEIDDFDMVFIETTGLSNPVPIIQTILCDEEIVKSFYLGKIITTIDCVEISYQLANFTEALHQVAVADTLLLTKTDLVHPNSMPDLRAKLQELNPGVTFALTINGLPEQISFRELIHLNQQNDQNAFLHWLDVGEKFVAQREIEQLEESMEQSSENNFSLKALYHSPKLIPKFKVQSFSFKREGEISKSSLVLWLNLLATLKGEKILRFKAILNVEGAPVALHATQTIVHNPIELEEWPDMDRSSRFVVISIGSIKKAFEESLALLDFHIETKPGVSLIDPKSYENFLKLTQSLGTEIVN